MYEYLLPIGTVVKVKGADKLLMIFGVLQKSEAWGGKIFDYIAVPYPEGRYNPRLDIAFNQDDVEKVVFRGYEDDATERKSFLAILELADILQKKQAAEKDKK